MIQESLGATPGATDGQPNIQKTISDTSNNLMPSKSIVSQEKRIRTGSFFSNYQDANQKQNQAENTQELSNMGSIKEIALFSRLANFKESSMQALKQEYTQMHPKILEIGLRVMNESYSSSNTRCAAMLQAIKHYVNVL